MRGDRAEISRDGSRIGVSTAATSLDEQGQEQEDVGRENCEENFFEAFAPMILRNTARRNGRLKWICHV